METGDARDLPVERQLPPDTGTVSGLRVRGLQRARGSRGDCRHLTSGHSRGSKMDAPSSAADPGSILLLPTSSC